MRRMWPAMCLLIACLLITCQCAVQVALADGEHKLTTSDRQVIATSAAWPAVITLEDGSVAMMYQLARPQRDFDATNVCMMFIRSTDNGKTWSEPVLVGERRGPDGELFESKPDGGTISFQERNEAMGQLPSGRIVAAWCRLNYHYNADGSDGEAPDVGRIHTNLGVVHTWSDDLGKTWVEPRYMDLGPFMGPNRAISPHWRIVTLEDGTAIMSLYGDLNPNYDGPVRIPENAQTFAGVMRSTDNGETWSDPSVIMHKQGNLCWEESALCLLDSGRLLSHTRTGAHDIVQYTSDDGGRTWQGPAGVTQGGQQPGGAFQLQSGKLMCTWGNRRAPFGAAAMLSYDGGESWDYANRVSLAWDAPNGNCGYANGTQTQDGTIIVAYYIMHYAGDNYRRLWGDSKVYIARFTEEQFLAAAE